MGVERQGAPGEVAPRPHGIGPSGFERNGVDRIPEGERTSTPGTFFVVFVGGSVGLGAIAFGWLGMYFGLGLWATISAIAVGTIVGQILLVPLILIGSRTATNNATSSGRHVRRARPVHRQRHRAADLPVLGGAHRVDQRIRRASRSRAGCSGCPTTPGTQGVAYALVAAVSVAVAIWGFRWLVRATAIICVLGGLVMILMLVAFAGSISWGYEGGEPLLGYVLAHVVPGGDDDRGLRRAARVHDPRRLDPLHLAPTCTRRAGWPGSARLGIFIGFVVPAAIGAIVTTAVHRPDGAVHGRASPTSRRSGTPCCCCRSRVFGGVGLVAQSLYSAGLDLEAVVVRLTRARATVIIGVIGVVLVYLGLLAPTDPGRGHGGVHRVRRARRAVGDDRRDRVPAHPRPLRPRRPAGVQPRSHRRPLLVLRGLELAGRAGLGRRVDRRAADDPDPALPGPAREHRGRASTSASSRAPWWRRCCTSPSPAAGTSRRTDERRTGTGFHLDFPGAA